MNEKTEFSPEQALEIGMQLGLDWTQISLEQFRRGLEVEFEYGATYQGPEAVDNDTLIAGYIASSHLKVIRDYYTRLDKLEMLQKFKSG